MSQTEKQPMVTSIDVLMATRLATKIGFLSQAGKSSWCASLLEIDSFSAPYRVSNLKSQISNATNLNMSGRVIARTEGFGSVAK